MPNTVAKTLLITLILPLFLINGSHDSSFAQTPCSEYTIENITGSFAGNSTSPSISGDGARIAFESVTDITEENTGGTYQIFIYDTQTGEFSQITDDPKWGSVAPSLSGDGTNVAFVSGADLKGNNPDALNLIYLYEIESGELSQITTKGNSFEPSTSSEGSQVAFTSNMDQSTEAANIFIYDSLSGTTTEISNVTEGWSDHPKISGSGRYVVFQSNPNISGPNAEKNTEIYLFDVVSGAAAPITISGTEIGSLSPSISSEGRFVAFQSDSNVDNDNPKGGFNIYLYDSQGGKIERVIKEPGAGSTGASINSDGTLIAFQSSGDFSGTNPEGNVEIFLYDNVSSEFKQITDTKSGIENTGARISGDGSHIVYVYDDTSEEANPEQKSDVYLASCAVKDVSGLSSDMLNWVILIIAIVLGAVLLVILRRRGR